MTAATDIREMIREHPDLRPVVLSGIDAVLAEHFAEVYGDDPERFVLECFDWGEGEGPTPYQRNILAAFRDHRRVAVRSPHASGKTAAASWLVLHFALTQVETRRLDSLRPHRRTGMRKRNA